MDIRPLPVVRSADAALWYEDERALALGCTQCPDFDLCGGLRIRGGAYDCRALCACARGGRKCSGLCRGDQREFIRRVREIDGFALDTVRRTAPVPMPAIPA